LRPRAARSPRCRLLSTLLLAGVACVLALVCGSAEARRHHRHRSRSRSSEKAGAAAAPLSLLAQAQADLAAGQLDGLQARLAAAYRDQPQPELLRLLGLLAEKQGRLLRAQDLLRRYFADPLAQPDSQAREDAQRVLARPRPPHGELQVRGERGAVLLVDDEVVGSLPLPQPLLLEAGSHKVTMEGQETTLHRTLKVRPGRGAVMRFDTATRAVVVSFPPSVIVLPGLSSLPQEAVLRIELLIEQATQRAGLSLFNLDAARAAAPEHKDCALTSERCRVEMARRNQAEYVLLLSAQAGARTGAAAPQPTPASSGVTAPPARRESVRLTMALLDAEVGEDAARREVGCESCGVPELMALLGGALDRLLAESIARPRGVLRVESVPPSAEALIGARPPRRTPFEQTLFAGRYLVTLRQIGFNDALQTAQVSDGQTTVLRVPLESPDPGPEPPPSLPVRAPGLRRPLWRIVSGSAAIGVGALLTGFGASALAVDGTCIEPAVAPALVCRDLFDTRSQGIGLLTAGLLVAAGGAVLLALPPSRGTTARVALRPGGVSLSLSF
jgi:hypothetical protein